MSVKHRDSKQEMAVWVARVAELRLKEGLCPGCVKARKSGELICETHKYLSRSMVFGHVRGGRFKTISGWRTCQDVWQGGIRFAQPKGRRAGPDLTDDE